MNKIIGGILLAVGILIAGASGICSLAVLTGGLFGGPGSPGEILSSLGLILLFGGPPFAIGAGLIFAGRAMIRHGRAEEAARAIPHESSNQAPPSDTPKE
jgi:hypothetical protein